MCVARQLFRDRQAAALAVQTILRAYMARQKYQALLRESKAGKGIQDWAQKYRDEMEKRVSGLKSQNGLLEAEEDDLNRMIQEQSQQMIEDDHKEKVALFSFNLLVELLGEGQQSIRPGAGTSTSATRSSRGQPSSREHKKAVGRQFQNSADADGRHYPPPLEPLNPTQ
ncbi:unnamed protein product [Gadus morhua 'NCC']